MADQDQETPKPRRSNAARKPAPPEPVEIDMEIRGSGTVKMWGCPFCGHNNEDRSWTEQHIAFTHPGGESP